MTALMKVANGMAKNTPQNPHNPPKTRTAVMMEIGCKFTVSEKISGNQYIPINELQNGIGD